MALWLLPGLFWPGGAVPADNDSWMHVVRLLEIAERGAWLNGATFRDGAPTGYALHWTMPLDLVAAALAAPLAALDGWEAALRAAAPYAAWATGMLLVAAVAWAGGLWGGGHVAVLAGILAATATPFIHYGHAGIADHHLLIVAASLAAVVSAARLETIRHGIAAGMVGGAALWVALEAMPAAMAGAALVGLHAVAEPARLRRPARAYALALVLSTLAALALDWPAAAATTDRLGPVLLLAALLAAVVVVLATRSSGMATFAAGAVAALAWLAVYRWAQAHAPNITNPFVAEYFWTGVGELRPIDDAAQAAFLLGQPVLACLTAAVLAWRSEGGRRLAWLSALLAQLALLVMACLWTRLSLQAGVPAALILAAGLGRLMARPLPPGWRLLRPLATLAAVALPLGLGVALHAPAEASDKHCDVREAAALLERGGGATVFADINLSAPLLYHSRTLRTVSGPYHVNPSGLTDLVRFGRTGDEAEARQMLARRQAGFVLVCASGGMPDGPMRRRLTDGAPPAWLEPVALGDPAGAALRLYRVNALMVE